MSHSSAALRLEPHLTPSPVPVTLPLTIVEQPAPAEASSLTIFELPLTIFEVPQPQKARSLTLWARLQPWLQKFGVMRLMPGTERRMRVSETVNLGEKRFVSLVEIDGVSLLIGGGSGGVQLLTQLGEGSVPKSFQSEIDNAWWKRGTA